MSGVEISAATVRALRERTGIGVMACRNALLEAHGDLDRAADLLRDSEALIAKAKADRPVSQGLIGVGRCADRVALLEANCESDFVARSDLFVDTVRRCVDAVIATSRENPVLPNELTRLDDMLLPVMAKTGERVAVTRAAVITAPANGVLATYVHGGLNDVGSIGVAIALVTDSSHQEVQTLGRGLAMHVAASDPQWIATADIPADVIAAKTSELEEEAARAGKPPAIVRTVVAGRLRKFCEGSTLLQQPYVLDPEKSVADAIRDVEVRTSSSIAVNRVIRFKVGDVQRAAS